MLTAGAALKAGVRTGRIAATAGPFRFSRNAPSVAILAARPTQPPLRRTALRLLR